MCKVPCMSPSWGREVSQFQGGWRAMQCVSHRNRNPQVPRATELRLEPRAWVLCSGFWVGLYLSGLDFGEKSCVSLGKIWCRVPILAPLNPIIKVVTTGSCHLLSSTRPRLLRGLVTPPLSFFSNVSKVLESFSSKVKVHRGREGTHPGSHSP